MYVLFTKRVKLNQQQYLTSLVYKIVTRRLQKL